jgi:predicted PurR-regulated permease PerM/methylmalonyl-CoA mutase cobalamin-binding subunit
VPTPTKPSITDGATEINERRTTAPLAVEPERDERRGREGAATPILAIIVATIVLYFAKEILIPLTMATVLAVIFSPLATRLERFVGNFASAAIVVFATVTLVIGIGYFVSVELTQVAVQVTGYTDNIAAKLTALKGSTPEWLQRVQNGVKDVEQQVGVQAPAVPKRSKAVTVVQSPPPQTDLEQVIKPAIPILSGLFEALVVIVLMFFLLYGRMDLRDRMVRLAARGRITLSAEAIETAGSAVGQYLLLFAMTNFGYGAAIGLSIWFIGLPNPLLWGALAALFRFVPYVGVPIAGLLPTLVAFAVFPGWRQAIEVLGTFIVLDQIVSYLIEPFVIGRGIGLSPLALLFSAMFWGWLWGLPGLLLATSLTACLKVAGDHIPALGFFAVLFGDDGAREDYHDYYRSLLELDPESAREIANRYCDSNGLEATFDEVLAPAVVLAGEEHAESHISDENQKLVFDTTLAVVKELGNIQNKPKLRRRIRVLGVAAPGEVHNLGLLMLLELLRRTGIAANVLDASKTPAEICAFVSQYAPDMVFLTCTTEQFIPAAIELVRALIESSPHLAIVSGGTAAVAHRAELLEAGAAEVCATRAEVRHVVRLYALRRSVSQPPQFGIFSASRSAKNALDPAFAGLRTVTSGSAPADLQTANGVGETPTAASTVPPAATPASGPTSTSPAPAKSSQS